MEPRIFLEVDTNVLWVFLEEYALRRDPQKNTLKRWDYVGEGWFPYRPGVEVCRDRWYLICGNDRVTMDTIRSRIANGSLIPTLVKRSCIRGDSGYYGGHNSCADLPCEPDSPLSGALFYRIYCEEGWTQGCWYYTVSWTPV